MGLSALEKSYLTNLREAFVSSGTSALLRTPGSKLTLNVMYDTDYFEKFYEYFGYQGESSEFFKNKKTDIRNFLKGKMLSK